MNLNAPNSRAARTPRRLAENVSIRAVGVMLLVIVVSSGCKGDPQAAARNFMAEGDAYAAQGKLKEASIEYRNALKAAPDLVEAHYQLGRIYLQTDEPEKAYQSFLRAANLDSSHADAHVKAGTLLLVAGDYREARALAERALKASPESADAHILLGNALAGLDNPSRALHQIEQAIHLDPTYAPAWTALGALQFQGAVDLDPKSADARVALANYEWAAGDTKAAEAALRATLLMAPQNPDAHRAIALLYLTTKRAKLAEPHFQALATDTRGKLALADYYLGTAQEAAARHVLNELAAGDNKAHSRAARLRLATLEYSAGRKPAAHRIVDEILAEHPRSVEARNAKARMLLDDGSVEEAAEAARTAITFDAGSVAAHYTLGLTAIARERFDEAEREFLKVAELNPRAGAAQIQLARLGLAAGDPERALRAAQKAVDATPEDPAATVLLARSQRAQGELAKAHQTLVSRIARQPNAAVLHAELGWVLLDRRDPTGARESFAEALRLAPASAEARTGLVTAYLAAGQAARAQTQIDTWLADSPADPGLRVLSARVAMASGRADDAERVLREIVSGEPGHLEAYDLLARMYVARGDMARAQAEYEALASRSPAAAGPRTMAAMISETRGNRAAAIADYERALADNPRAGVAANNLAWIRAEEGRLDDAIRLAGVAVDVMKNRPEPHDTLGWAYYKQGHPGRAISSFERALTIAPENATYHYHLGLAYLKAGDVSRGRAALSRALALKPDAQISADARRVMADTAENR
jgi:tetratricopeptide (TPR) repeat protein